MANIYWSKSEPGFYRDDVMPKTAMPADVVVITAATYSSLLAGQSAGQHIVNDANGDPVLQNS
jgi:hypothetical protein